MKGYRKLKVGEKYRKDDKNPDGTLISKCWWGLKIIPVHKDAYRPIPPKPRPVKRKAKAKVLDPYSFQTWWKHHGKKYQANCEITMKQLTFIAWEAGRQNKMVNIITEAP